MQCWVWTLLPWHLFPPYFGGGSSQNLDLVRRPGPQVAPQEDQAVQRPQWPCTGAETNFFLSINSDTGFALTGKYSSKCNIQRERRSQEFKVAEQFSRALLLMGFSARTGIAKTNMPLIQRSFYLLNACSIFAIFLRNWTQCVAGFSLYNKGMLKKVTTQRTQQFSAFVCFWKNPVKCSTCAAARKIETDCFCRNLPISDDPVVRISGNVAKKWFRNHVTDPSRKIWILTYGIFSDTENDLGQITKIAYVKFVLEQCWHWRDLISTRSGQTMETI